MNYFVLSGHSRLPSEAVAKAQSDTLSISVHVDRTYGVILQADTTLVTQSARRYVHDLLVGVALSGPAEPVLEELERTYWGGAKRAIEAAIRDLFRKWEQIGGEPDGKSEVPSPTESRFKGGRTTRHDGATA